MASGTEKALWTRLQSAARHYATPAGGPRFTRIETPIALGVSDVEYVLLPYHGWIELKAATSRGDDKPLHLHEPLKATQCQWLMSHHSPQHNLRSYLLIGVVGAREWREYLLLTARASVALLYQRLAPTYGSLKRMPGVMRCSKMAVALQHIRAP